MENEQTLKIPEFRFQKTLKIPKSEFYTLKQYDEHTYHFTLEVPRGGELISDDNESFT